MPTKTWARPISAHLAKSSGLLHNGIHPSVKKIPLPDPGRPDQIGKTVHPFCVAHRFVVAEENVLLLDVPQFFHDRFRGTAQILAAGDRPEGAERASGGAAKGGADRGEGLEPFAEISRSVPGGQAAVGEGKRVQIGVGARCGKHHLPGAGNGQPPYVPKSSAVSPGLDNFPQGEDPLTDDDRIDIRFVEVLGGNRCVVSPDHDERRRCTFLETAGNILDDVEVAGEAG